MYVHQHIAYLKHPQSSNLGQKRKRILPAGSCLVREVPFRLLMN